MKELGENFSKSGVEAHGFSSLDNVFWNLNQEASHQLKEPEKKSLEFLKVLTIMRQTQTLKEILIFPNS